MIFPGTRILLRTSLIVALVAAVTGGAVAASAPVFSITPQSPMTVAGISVNFSSVATGDPAPAFQWRRLPATGSEWEILSDDDVYTGTATGTLYVLPTEAMNGDQFRVTASNSEGAVQSSEATLGVQPALPPRLTAQPSNRIVEAGGEGAFSVGVDHNPHTLVYRWQHRLPDDTEWSDVPYDGPASSYLRVLNVSGAMNGERFRVIITNAFGSVTSTAATLTVTPTLPPSLKDLPSARWVSGNDLLRIVAEVTGSWPYTMQWYRDGLPLAGETGSSFYHWGISEAYSGTYTVVATNSAGVATSTPIQVVVNTPMAPVLVSAPVSLEVEAEKFAPLYVEVAGSPPLTYTWYHNGVQVKSNAEAYLTYNEVTAQAAGTYTVTIANALGSVTSAPATLVVLPRPLPAFTSWAPQTSLSKNRRIDLTPTFSSLGYQASYQWFKDDQPISGAKSDRYPDVYNSLPSIAGTYRVEATNERGTVVSPDVPIDWLSSDSKPWLDAARYGNIVYFLMTVPARLLRYDLEQAVWLPEVILPEEKVPTAFLPTAEGVFIAFNKNLVRRAHDLTGEIPVATSATKIDVLFAARDFIYFRDGEAIRARHRSTLAAGPNSFPGQSAVTDLTTKARPAYSAAAQSLVITPTGSTPRIYRFPVVANGVIVPAPYDDSQEGLPMGKRQLMLPGGLRMLNNEGAIHSVPELRYLGSIGGTFDDADFLEDGSIVVLRGPKLTRYRGAGYAEVGGLKLAGEGYALFHQGDTLFVFGETPSGGMPVVRQVDVAALVTAPGRIARSPLNRQISAEEVFIDANRVINVISRSEVGVVRWDTASRQFLPTIPLPARPGKFSFAPALGRLVLTYLDGGVSDLFPAENQPGEQRFANYAPESTQLYDLLALDDLASLKVGNAYDSGGTEFLLGDLGEKRFVGAAYDGFTRTVWMSSHRRVYGWISFPRERLAYKNVSPDGTVTAAVNGPETPLPERLVVSEGSDLLFSSVGRIYNADLEQVGAIDNPVTDGVLLAGRLFTIRIRPDGMQMQRWAAETYAADGQVMLPGRPVRIFRVNADTLAVVTTTHGYLGFHLVNDALEIIGSVLNDLNSAPVRPAYFDAEAYLANNPDLAATIGNSPDRAQKAWEHYWRYGLAEGRTDGDFNVSTYLAQYPDLAVQFGSDLKAAALHWYTIGRAQGLRIPNGFDVEGYFARNLDVKAVYVNDKYGAWLHYYNYGLFEGRSFDTNFIAGEYLELNLDLKAAGGGDLQGAVLHWLSYGHPIEDRMGRVPIGFNVENYLARYPDLAAAFANVTPVAVRNVAVWHHYIAYGTLEGRSDGDFEAYDYLATNADLAAIFAGDVQTAALHWFFYGRREGRRIPFGFDVVNYRALYPDLVVFSGDDLYGCWLHYRDTGINEGRIYDNKFRPADYLALNPDIAAAVGNNHRDAFLHWIYYGQFEGRQGKF